MNENKESMMRRFGVNDTDVVLKAVIRDEIALQVDEFLASGGAVQCLDINERTEFDPQAAYRNYPDGGGISNNLGSSDHGLPYAAKFLGMLEKKLRALIAAGKGPAHTVVQRGERFFCRFKMADLVAFKKQIEAVRS